MGGTRNACLDGVHKPTETSCFRTQVLNNGRPSLLQPCSNRFYIRHDSSEGQSGKLGAFLNGTFEDGLRAGVFVQTKNDNKPGPSVEDRKFINIMETSLTEGVSGTWETPLNALQRDQKSPQKLERCSQEAEVNTAYPRRESYHETTLLRSCRNCLTIGKQKLYETPSRPQPLSDGIYPNLASTTLKKPEKSRAVFDSAAETNKWPTWYPDMLSPATRGFLGRHRTDVPFFPRSREQ